MPILRLLLQIVLSFALWSGASAETYPSHPIKIIVPYPPGGNTDLVGRMFAQRLGEILKVSVVIDNRGGGGGTIGVDAAARAEPDGYTLLHATNSELAVVPAVQPNLPYDPIKNLIAISTTCEFPFVLVTRKDLPVQSVQDLVALARQKPGTLTFASVGVGSANHLVIEPFKALFHAPAFRMIEIDRPRRDAVKIGFRNNREEREAVLIRWPQELSGFWIAANTDAVGCLNKNPTGGANASNDILVDRHVGTVVALRIPGMDMDHGGAFVEAERRIFGDLFRRDRNFCPFAVALHSAVDRSDDPDPLAHELLRITRRKRTMECITPAPIGRCPLDD